jgi:hypothetical protein
MAKHRLCLRERIEIRRRKELLPAEIARYVYDFSHGRPNNVHRGPLYQEELNELEKLIHEVAERKAQKTEKAAEEAVRRAEWLASLPPDPPNLGRAGLSPKDALEILGCNLPELNRWVADNRLPPDGRKFYHNMGGAKSLWGRSWRRETVDNAKPYVEEWRALDEIADIEKGEKRQGKAEYRLFNLVRSRHQDAVPHWSSDWLGRQHVDIYVPSINVAFEYQGEQHYKPVAIYGGEKKFWDTRERDARKQRLLKLHGVYLIEWRFDRPITDVELDRALAFLGAVLPDEPAII